MKIQNMQNENVSNSQKNESPKDGNLKTEDPSIDQSNEAKRGSNSKYPRGIPFILMFKFGERFSFYVFYVILTLYLHHELNFDESITQTIFHTFMMLVYFMVIFGALLADAYLAKFWAIFWISLLYIIGHFFVFTGSTLSNDTTMRTVSLVGLALVAVSNGGGKPCSSAFGGDQFEEHQYTQRKRYFALYYFVIYSGHILASFLAPILRSHVRCFGKDTCYPLAFGTTALMSSLGTIAFFTGKPFYRIFEVEEGILIKVLKCIGYALSRKMRNKSVKKEHWLDYAEDKFDKSIISDTKALFHVLQVYIPLPLFYTLLHQVGSTWVLQASKMDGEILGYRIKPDQMVMFLPVLMSIIIPTFEFAVYPLFNKLGMLRTHLQKIWIAGILNALAFTMAGFLQLRIERELPIQPEPGLAELMVINNCPCTIKVTSADNIILKAFETKVLKDLPVFQERQWKIVPSDCSAKETAKKTFRPETQFETMMITLEKSTLGVFVRSDIRLKLKNGNPRVRLFYRTDTESVSFLFRGASSLAISANDSKIGMTEYWEIHPGAYEIYLKNSNISLLGKPVGLTKFKSGGSYIVVIYQSSNENKTNFNLIPTLKWNSVHILYQLPQYFAIASAEVMFAVQGTAFSYAEAPVSMKAIIQACFFLIFGFGNALLLFLKLFTHLLKDSQRFFFFAILLFSAMMIFMVIAHFYTYINDEEKKK